MPVPKSVTKINKDGVQYISSCDKVNYTIKELTRAALRDSCKYACSVFRQSYYAKFQKKSGRVGKFTQYWVRSKQDNPDAQIGIKPSAFYGLFQEVGSSKTHKLGLLQHAVQDNVAKIVEIQSQYLSHLENEAKALAIIEENDYLGGAEDE
jgi:hypothetical protein